MGYTSRHGRRPDEYASKASHGHIIRDYAVQDFLTRCDLPKRAGDVTFAPRHLVPYVPVSDNPIQQVIAVDGGFQEVVVQPEFPSSTVCFFQFGALLFNIEDLDNLSIKPFIDPDDMSKLKTIQRLKLTLPIRNIKLGTESTLTRSVRRTIYDFFLSAFDGELCETLKWFLFEEYRGGVSSWVLASCPACGQTAIPLSRTSLTKTYTLSCSHCHGEIFLTDVFRLHEAIDDELGAGGILGYVVTALEQLILVHAIRLILSTKPALLNQVLFIKDGPLAFFGQTANMHKPMRALVKYLFGNHNLYLAGLEKSGPFVEHADEIVSKLDPGTALLLDNDYIYQYVLPGKADPLNPYGRTTYYSNKLIFKTRGGQMYVASLPTTEVKADPSEADFRNLQVVLTNIEKLKCDMYDNALVPVALVNKLVSLASHPSAKILQRFAKQHISQ